MRSKVRPQSEAEPSQEGPLYRKVVDALKRDLREGRFPIGSRLPSEGELCDRFGVSRHTVREALRQLRVDGLVASRQGAGTTVLRPGTPPLYVHTVSSVEELTQYAQDTHYRIDSCERVLADRDLAAQLGGVPGQAWLRVRGFRYAAERLEPICWTEVFVRGEFGGIERLLSRSTGPIYGLIEDLYGERIAKVEQILRARPIPENIAVQIQAEPEAIGIEVCRLYFLADGTLVEAAFNLYPADRFSYSMTLHRGNEALGL